MDEIATDYIYCKIKTLADEVEKSLYKDLLIDYYRPKYNAESNSKEPKFDGQPLWEPNWILLEDYLKENSTVDSGKDIIMPTLSQIKEAESRYNIYLSDYEDNEG